MFAFLLHAPRDDFLTRLFRGLRFIERQLIDPFAEEEQLSWIERFVLRTVETLEQRGGCCFDGFLHCLFDGDSHG